MNSRRKFKAVLFDLDGTLVEFKFDIKESRLALIGWLSRNGFDTSGFSSATKTQKIFSVIDLQCQLGRSSVSFEIAKREMSKILETFEFRCFSEARPYSTSLHLLERLNQEGILAALVTNSGRRPVDSVLKVLGFAPCFSITITRDEMTRMKPEPDGIIKAIQELRVSTAESIYVGDSVIDIQAAKKAGVQSVAITNGMYSGETLAKEGPDYLIPSIDEVEEIVFSQDI